MPVYEYVCEGCECRFEQYREVSQRAACRCPKCGKLARKTIRPVGIIFKGSGFHVTDYRKPGDKAKSDSEPAAVGLDKDSKKS